MSMETVFAAVAGYLVLSETFGGRELFGAALMLAGFVMSQVPRLLPAKR
jgi:drug/metabolite transporter (DMT)-like permease